MHWNEKIDLIKKNFTDDEFSVPHVNRKDILRKIETKFIVRPKDYYALNTYRGNFNDWWKHHIGKIDFTIQSDYQKILNTVLNTHEHYWIAFDFTGQGVLIYKSKLSAMIPLVGICQTWSRTFHVILLKYDYMMSCQIDNDSIQIKASDEGGKLIQVLGNIKKL